jgi:polysaccharide biosynthesis transport protein
MNSFNFLTFYYEARRFRWLLLLILTCSLAGGYWWSIRQAPQYISEAKMVVAGRINMDAGSAYSEDKDDFLGTQAAIMQGDEVTKRARQDLAAAGIKEPSTRTDLRAAFIPRTEIFQLTATGSDSVYTQAFLRGAMRAFFSIRKEMRLQRSEETRSAISQEIVRVQKELDQATQDLNTFQRRFSVVSLEEDVNATTGYLDTLHKRIADLRLERSVAATGGVDAVAAGAAIPTGNDDNSGVTAGTGGDADGQSKERLVAVQQDLAVQQTQKDRLSRNLRPEHPKIKEVDNKIAEDEKIIALLSSQQRERTQDQIAAIDRETDLLEKDIQQKQDHLLEVNNNLAEYKNLKSSVDSTRETYNKLIAEVQSVGVGEQIEQEPIAILETASASKLVPKHAILGLVQGAFLGSALALGLILLLARLLPRFQSAAAVKEAVGLPVYGKILHDRWFSRSRTVLDCDQAHIGFAESFRSLRSGLLNRPQELAKQRCFAVTSATPGEGKSTVTVNLGIAIAATNARVLLIDGDLRRGRLHQLLGLQVTVGFSDLLIGNATSTAVLHSTRMQNLFLLPAGPKIANTTELLLRFGLDELFRELHSRFDYIIVDAPPVLAADDAMTLASRVSWTMFVVRLGYSQPANSLKALDELTSRQIKVPGVVINDVPRDQITHSYYHYYHQLESRPFFMEMTNAREKTAGKSRALSPL